MILDTFLNRRQNRNAALMNIGVGALSTVFPFAIVLWFYTITLQSFSKALGNINRDGGFYFGAFAFYLVSLEFLSRLVDIAPFIPYEVGKYLLVFIFLLGLLIRGGSKIQGLLLTLLLAPALFFDLSGQVNWSDIVFNIFGPLALALGVAFFYRTSISRSQMDDLLRIIWMGLLGGLIYVLIKTPDYETIEFSLDSQSETSAGGASNQVSTMLGLGMFLSFYSIIYKLRFSGATLTDVVIMLLFAFQGLLTFSRGGMLVGALGMALVYGYSNLNYLKKNFTRFLTISIFVGLGAFFVFNYINKLSGGLLLLRYQGETRGTLLGAKDKTADVLLTGRVSIFEKDMLLWSDHPILGVGAAASQYLREGYKGVRSHVELSRLLADHGLLGLIFFILLIYYSVERFSKSTTWDNKILILVFFCFALISTFHAGMRTFITPVMFSLLCFKVYTK